MTDPAATLRADRVANDWTLNYTFGIARRRYGWGRAKVREVLFGRPY